MNLRQLEYFVVIADTGSLTAAAERLFVTQPSISQQIRALEQELGGQLLERLAGGLHLTAAGQSLRPEARTTTRHADRGRHVARRALGLEAGHLELVPATSTAAGILPPVVRAWQQSHPRIEVSLLEFPHRRLLDEAVRDGAGDIAVGQLPTNWQGPIERLGWEEFMVVLPQDDPLIGSRTVQLADLAERRWVHFAPAHGLAQVLDFACATAGYSPRVALRTSQVLAAAQFAAAGLGPTLMPQHTVPDALAALARPASPRITRPVVAFTRTAWSPLTSAFLTTLRTYPWPTKPRSAIDLG